MTRTGGSKGDKLAARSYRTVLLLHLVDESGAHTPPVAETADNLGGGLVKTVMANAKRLGATRFTPHGVRLRTLLLMDSRSILH
jgi:hypothetical protein